LTYQVLSSVPIFSFFPHILYLLPWVISVQSTVLKWILPYFLPLSQTQNPVLIFSIELMDPTKEPFTPSLMVMLNPLFNLFLQLLHSACCQRHLMQMEQEAKRLWDWAKVQPEVVG
jgi:hypothetical protein